MSWPQYTMIVMLAITLIYNCAKAVKDPRLNSEWATFVIFAWVVYIGVYGALLHAGGFW